jgi:hypothetical protein
MISKVRPALIALVTGGAIFGLFRLGSRRSNEQRQPVIRDDFSLVDEAGEESFPASDPPSWTLGEERPG